MTNQLKKSLLASFAAVAIFAVSTSASAAGGPSTVNGGTIGDITIDGTSFARVYINNVGTIPSRPSCNNSGFFAHYAWDLSTAKGKALLSLLQAAQLSGKKVFLTGSTACTSINAQGGGLFVIETLTTAAIAT
jgi:hypothetical protein